MLKAVRTDESLPEPDKQYEVFEGNRLLTGADFADLDCEPKLLLYVDGFEWHSDVKQRTHDNRVTNELQTLGYRVRRFLGPEMHHAPQARVTQIKEARGFDCGGGSLQYDYRITQPVVVVEVCSSGRYCK